jgi:hypothetical protein
LDCSRRWTAGGCPRLTSGTTTQNQKQKQMQPVYRYRHRQATVRRQHPQFQVVWIFTAMFIRVLQGTMPYTVWAEQNTPAVLCLHVRTESVVASLLWRQAGQLAKVWIRTENCSNGWQLLKQTHWEMYWM